MKLRIIITAALALALRAGFAQAQTTMINPNGIGGYNIYRPGAPTTQVLPNGIGGYNAYTPGQGTTMISPNGIGGYTVYPPPPRPYYPSSPQPRGNGFGY